MLEQLVTISLDRFSYSPQLLRQCDYHDCGMELARLAALCLRSLSKLCANLLFFLMRGPLT